jgi:hypothetical protein
MAKQKKQPAKRKSKPIDWNDPQNSLPIHVVAKIFPFYGSVLASMYNMSTGMVYYRLKQHGISLRDVHRGLYGRGKEVRKEYSATNVTARVAKDAVATHKETFTKKKK